MDEDNISKGPRESLKERLVREKGWYVPALHDRYIEMRRRDGNGKG